MPMQFRPGEPPVDPVLGHAPRHHAHPSSDRPGPYEAGYDVLLGYEGAAVERQPAEAVVWFGGRGIDRR
jgi:hypothetical protein